MAVSMATTSFLYLLFSFLSAASTSCMAVYLLLSDFSFTRRTVIFLVISPSLFFCFSSSFSRVSSNLCGEERTIKNELKKTTIPLLNTKVEKKKTRKSSTKIVSLSAVIETRRLRCPYRRSKFPFRKRSLPFLKGNWYWNTSLLLEVFLLKKRNPPPRIKLGPFPCKSLSLTITIPR